MNEKIREKYTSLDIPKALNKVKRLNKDFPSWEGAIDEKREKFNKLLRESQDELDRIESDGLLKWAAENEFYRMMNFPKYDPAIPTPREMRNRILDLEDIIEDMTPHKPKIERLHNRKNDFKYAMEYEIDRLASQLERAHKHLGAGYEAYSKDETDPHLKQMLLERETMFSNASWEFFSAIEDQANRHKEAKEHNLF